MTAEIEKKIKNLRKEIVEHNRKYHTEAAPSISDAAYDALMKELKSLEKAYPQYASKDSPTVTVGSPVPENFRKVGHIAPMLSLESINDEPGAEKFDTSCRKQAGKDINYICEPKLDGISIELVYEKGVLARGTTRGDGVTGEDVTSNLKTVFNVPHKLRAADPPAMLSVRGEVMMHIKDFNELNKKQISMGKETFANPRNVVAGSMRQLDPAITARRKLRVYCYRILGISDKFPSTQKDAIAFMEELGLPVVPDMKYCRGIREAVERHHELEEKREDMDYEIDGVVIKVNDMALQEKLGMRTSNPRWAVAYKFKPRKEITRLEDIVVQVGRTGILTPLALLQPVDVGGVTVSKATLHNMDQVARLDINIGDHVKVERAGDVIPYITEVVREKRTGKEIKFKMPEKCPSCGTKVVKEDVFYRCPAGLECPAQVKESIIHYASKQAVDIDGFSEKTVESFYDLGLIKDVSDIYDLKREDILPLEGWKEKKTDNLLSAIENSKNTTLDRFIFALGIRNVGKHLASVLSDRFGSLEKLMGSSKEELMDINEIGPEIAESITAFFSEKKNIRQIEKLKSSGLVIAVTEKNKGGIFYGQRVVFTGTLVSLTRSEAKDIVEKEGGRASSSVGPSTDLVVAGEKAGSKLKKAGELGIKVISEEEFRNMLK